MSLRHLPAHLSLKENEAVLWCGKCTAGPFIWLHFLQDVALGDYGAVVVRVALTNTV
jgi:hypothetical protein